MLTVVFSSDQVINAEMKGYKGKTVIDICPFTKYYFYLKRAALVAIDYDRFSNYFCCFDYTK